MHLKRYLVLTDRSYFLMKGSWLVSLLINLEGRPWSGIVSSGIMLYLFLNRGGIAW